MISVGPFRWERRCAMVRGKPTGPESIVILDATGAKVAAVEPGEWSHRTAAAIVASLNHGRSVCDEVETAEGIAAVFDCADIDDLEANASEYASRPAQQDLDDAEAKIEALEIDVKRLERELDEATTEKDNAESARDELAEQVSTMSAAVEAIRSRLARVREAVGEGEGYRGEA